MEVRQIFRRDRPRPPSTIWHLAGHGIVYVEVPKAATRSIRFALAAFALDASAVPSDRKPVQVAAERFERLAEPATIRDLARDAFAFTFVRDPLDRLFSAYTDKIVELARGRGKNIFRRDGISADATFPEFVRAVAELDDDDCDRHLRSQHRFVCLEEEPVVEFVGHLERIGDDWGRLQERFGLPELPRKNVSQHEDYRSAYSPELARIAAHRYARDIAIFGYEEAVAALTA